MDRIRRGGEQAADHEIALGEPRAFIEQPSGPIKRLEIELDERRASRGPTPQRLVVSCFRFPVTEEDQLPVAWHAEAKICGEPRRRTKRPIARERISLVRPRHHRKRKRGIVDREREYRDAVEGAAGWHQAGGRDHAEARLQPDDIVEHCRHTAGSCGVGAERQRHEARANRSRRAGARAAQNQILADRISGNAVGRTHSDEAGRELVEIGLADDDGAGRAQALHCGGVTRRRIGEGRACGGGRKAQRVDIVLDRDRHAVQRQAGGILACGELLSLRDRILLVA